MWASVDGDGLDGAWRHLGGFRVEEPGAPPRPVWLPPVAFDHEWTVGHERPASEAELDQKFLLCAERTLSPASAREALRRLTEITSSTDLRPLLLALAGVTV